MAKEKKITIDAFEKAAGKADNTFVLTWRGIEINVKKHISYEEMVTASAAIAENCFAEDGSYVPEALDLSLRLAVLALYTNLTIPSSMDKRYEMACFSGVADDVIRVIDRRQFTMLENCAKERVRVRAEAAVDAVIRKAGEAADSVKELRDKLDAEFSTILEKVSPDDIAAMIRGLAQGEVDEEKVAKIYMENIRRADEPMEIPETKEADGTADE